MSDVKRTIKPFIPGFERPEQAIKAGREYFARTNGRKGREGHDFHIIPNEHGRFHFEDGPGPVSVKV